jgi:hypothetical protein
MQGDIETAGRYYMASVNEISKPQDFVLPYIGIVSCAHALSIQFCLALFYLIISQHLCMPTFLYQNQISRYNLISKLLSLYLSLLLVMF